LSAQPIYDIRIWEEIRNIVTPKLDVLVLIVKNEISKDSSLAEFQGTEPIPWQLAQIIEQRGEAWLQRLYDVCRNVYKSKGKTPSEGFNRAVWAFCIEPFVMDGDPERILSYEGSGFLQLLLCAVGSPPERRKLLKVSQKNCCLTIRAKLWKEWRDRLHWVLPRTDEPGLSSVRSGVIEPSMARTVSSGSPTPLPPPHSSDRKSILPLAPRRSVVPEAGSGTKSQEKTSGETPILNCIKPALVEPSMARTVGSGSPTPLPTPHPSDWESILPLAQRAGSGTHESTSGETPILNCIEPATWQGVEISFLSDERLQVFQGKRTETLNYAEFGFEDGRDGTPNRAWNVLRAMAENRGILHDTSTVGKPWTTVEKAIQEIRKELRHHFGISGDPIPFVKGVGYQACFKIGCSPSFRT